MRTLMAIAVPALLLIAGCSSEQAKTETTQETTARHEQAEAAANDAAPAQATGEEVVLTGTLACGHCTFEKTASCAVGMQTADGAMYIFDGVEGDSNLFEARRSGNQIRIVGTLTEKTDDLQHVMVTSYEM